MLLLLGGDGLGAQLLLVLLLIGGEMDLLGQGSGFVTLFEV